MRTLASYAQLRTQRESAEALAEQRRAIAEQRQVATAEAQRKQQEEASWRQALQGAYKPDGSIDQEALFKAVPPELMPLAQKTVVESQGLFEKFHQEQSARKASLIKDMATRVRQLGDNPMVFGTALRAIVTNGALSEEEAQTVLQRAAQGPEGIKTVLDQILHPEGQKLTEHDPTKPLIDPTGKVVVPAQPKEEPHSPILREYQDAKAQGFQGTFEQYQDKDANRKRSVTTINANQGAGDVKETVAGMKDGTLPPQLPGRASKEYVAIMAEAHRQGYDLATAATDWTVTQKHFQTLNGAQQTRIRQAVDTAYHSLDIIDTLADKWKGGKFPALNKITLTAAKQGAMGKEAQSIATQLDAQISDLTSELANVYMGGNSPTDHAMTLAAKNLSANWSNEVLRDMTKLARTNLQMRQNAIKNVGAIGTSENNPYGPKTDAGSTQSAPQRKPIPGIPGGIAELQNGKWIRVQ